MGEQKSVCYVNPALLLRRPISELIALQEGKRKISLLIPAKGAAHEKELHHTKLFSEAHISTYNAWHPPGPFEWPVPGITFLKKGWQALQEHEVVHMWAHFYPSSLLLMLKAFFHPKTRVILTMDTLPGYSFSMGPVMDALFKLYTWTLGRIVYGIPDIITLYGHSLLPHAKRSGINMKKVRVIPTGIIEHSVPSREEARTTIQKELQIEEKEIVLYAGLINPRKRVEDVLSVATEHPDVHFLIAGDGPNKEKLERVASEQGNVTFLGWRNDLLTLMRAADIFLFPSSAEGLPGVVMEAMYCETPVVTTRIPCTTDLITHKKEGMLCKTGDTKAMSKALKHLQQQKVRKEYARAAKKKITTQYSWKTILKEYEKLYM
jgi:glycosyltransferase involved in cell wall biosynthesis